VAAVAGIMRRTIDACGLDPRHLRGGEAAGGGLEEKRIGEQGGQQATVQPIREDAPEMLHPIRMADIAEIVTGGVSGERL
jgi:hypothetical protein